MPGRDPPLAESMSAGFIDRAETFGESSVTLTPDGTNVSGESVELSEYALNFTHGNTDTGTTAATILTVSEEVSTLGGTITGGTTGVEEVRLKDGDGTTLDTISGGLSGGSTVEFVGPWSAGTYILEGFGSGGMSGFGVGSGGKSDGPVSGTDGYIDGLPGDGFPRFWSTITADASSGEATVGWDHPSDIYRWDSVLFQATPDGETVTVDVQESTDGGSTWTTIATDVLRGQQITADPASDVRLKVNLSRTDAANNPTLDAAYRRYVI